MWKPFEDGATIGQEGSESGTILRDEHLEQAARITLERGAPFAKFAITCGIYGWMVHTRFFHTEDLASAQYEEMQGALTDIVATIPPADEPSSESGWGEVSAALSSFIQKYP